MDKIYQYIIENTASGKINRENAIVLLKMLTQEMEKFQPIAIIGIGARMPLADNPQMFWSVIRNKTDCIQAFPEGRRLEIERYLEYKKYSLDKLKFQEIAYLNEIDKFDNYFFRLSPKEASLMDPNQRLFLETSWSAIEDAGYGGKKLAGSRTGVYLGFSNNSSGNYQRLISDVDPSVFIGAVSGNLPAVIAARISYLLDLKGPAMLIDTACSSSLVAVHLACQGIRNRDCDLAVAGGVKIELTVIAGDFKLGIESSDGRTKTFDAISDGTGGGEGVVALLLKPYDKALKDGDHIYAVIKGSAINQDGSSIGITAPNVTAQESVICQAWENAGIDPETITYLEAHGTGTKLGDPIEIEGIRRAFQHYTQKRQFCAISSLKSNIGHLDHAAGIAGLLKAILALKHGEIPPAIHFHLPNREITFEDSPVYVNDRPIPWETSDVPRRCGVSAFGLSGTNCHIVLEEAPPVAQEEQITKRPQIFTVSAKSLQALKNSISAYRDYLETAPESDFTGICYTANTGRGHYNYRLAIIINHLDELREKVKQLHEADLAKMKEPVIYYRFHQLIGVHQDSAETGYLTYDQKNRLDLEAGAKIEQITSDSTVAVYREQLADLAGLYVQGADISWEKFYAGQKISKISIPTYVFERNRCWIEIPEVTEPERLYYATSWVPSVLDMPENTTNIGTTLVLHVQHPIGKECATQLKAGGHNVISVGLGLEFCKIDNDCYQIDGSMQSYEKLILEMKDRKIARILNFVETGDMQEFTASGSQAVHGFLHLVQAVQRHHSKETLEIIVIAERVYRVTGREIGLNPEAAMLFGLGKTVNLEYPHLKCRCIDIDESTKINDIIMEIWTGLYFYLVAYRDGRRYIETINELALETIAGHEIILEENGVYLITGGAGGIGLEFGKYLARKQPVNIAMVNRSPFPNRDIWDELMEDGANSKLSRKIQAIQEIESNGSKVTCYQADVSKREEIEPVISEIRRNYGKINGIIHAAGIGDGAFIVDETPESINKVLAAKVTGTWLLDHLTAPDDPKFFIMFSSVITVVSGFRAGSYTAANAFLDAYAGYRHQQGKKTLTINWPAWKETGLSEGASLDEHRQIFKVIHPSQALEAFEKVFHKDISNVIIGELNYVNPILSFKDHLSFHFSEAIVAEIKAIQNKQGVQYHSQAKSTPVILKGQSTGGYSEIQKQLAHIWGRVFGLNEVSIYTNFYEMGGDSILAMNLSREIETVYPGKIDITHIFSYPTIAEMAAFMEKKQKVQDESSESQAYDILDRLNKGELSVNEVTQLMEKVGQRKWN